MSVDVVSHWDGSVNFQPDNNGFLVMPDDITSVPRGAFSRNRNLRGIDLNNVRYVGERAFQECSNLETVIMRNVEAAGPESFGFCRSLRNVTFGRITDIGDSAFFYCGNLDIPEMPRSLVSVGSGAFSHTAVKRADLHWLREIPPSVFSYCTELEYADISGAAVIGSEAFLGCRSLTQVRLGGIEIIGAKAFRKCSSMVFTSLPDSLREIGDGAFCSVMPGIIIPENVTSFGRNCFGPPESRKSVKIYRSALHEFRNYFREDKVDQIYYLWESSMDVIVIDNETGTVAAILPLYTSLDHAMREELIRAFRPDNTFDYSVLDIEIYDNMGWNQKCKDRLAVMRLMYPYELSGSSAAEYTGYVSRHSRRIAMRAISDNNSAVLVFMFDQGLISRDDIPALADYSIALSSPECTAVLLQRQAELGVQRDFDIDEL